MLKFFMQQEISVVKQQLNQPQKAEEPNALMLVLVVAVMGVSMKPNIVDDMCGDKCYQLMGMNDFAL